MLWKEGRPDSGVGLVRNGERDGSGAGGGSIGLATIILLGGASLVMTSGLMSSSSLKTGLSPASPPVRENTLGRALVMNRHVREVVTSRGRGDKKSMFSRILLAQQPEGFHEAAMSVPTTVQRPHVLIVEDDVEIARILAETLSEAGMSSEIAGDGVQMDAWLRRATFDLIVLDVMLPGEDGFSLCRRVRGEMTVPIIMLTAQGEEVDRIVGLEIGADDYVTKPFSAREVTARIRSLLRRAAYAPSERHNLKPLRFDDWTLDPQRRQLRDPSGARVAMTTAEFDLLLVFCRNPGRILTREQLLAHTHSGIAGPIDRSVDVHIRRLRQKIETDPSEPILIKTVRLGGYMFTANVEPT